MAHKTPCGGFLSMVIYVANLKFAYTYIYVSTEFSELLEFVSRRNHGRQGRCSTGADPASGPRISARTSRQLKLAYDQPLAQSSSQSPLIFESGLSELWSSRTDRTGPSRRLQFSRISSTCFMEFTIFGRTPDGAFVFFEQLSYFIFFNCGYSSLCDNLSIARETTMPHPGNII